MLVMLWCGAGEPRWTDPKQGGADITVHGFRSSFRTWVSEETSVPGEIAEAALGHINGDKVERAYQRGEHLRKRRDLMGLWAQHCDGGTATTKVTELRARR
jgi:integrase